MDKRTVLKTLSSFREAMEKTGILVSRMILFGSFAKGTSNEDSDIDVVILSPSFSGKNLWDRIGILTPALREFPEPIEAIALTPEEWDEEESLIILYAKEGEVVYSSP